MKNYFVILSYLIFLMTKYDHIIGVNFFDIMVEHHIIINNFVYLLLGLIILYFIYFLKML